MIERSKSEGQSKPGFGDPSSSLHRASREALRSGYWKAVGGPIRDVSHLDWQQAGKPSQRASCQNPRRGIKKLFKHLLGTPHLLTSWTRPVFLKPTNLVTAINRSSQCVRLFHTSVPFMSGTPFLECFFCPLTSQLKSSHYSWSSRYQGKWCKQTKEFICSHGNLGLFLSLHLPPGLLTIGFLGGKCSVPHHLM